MAKITITIEDTIVEGRKGVKVESTPNFETMMMIHTSGAGLTAAHGYAFAALNRIRQASKDNRMKIIIPRLS